MVYKLSLSEEATSLCLLPSPALKDPTAQEADLPGPVSHHRWSTEAESNEMRKGFHLFSQECSSCRTPFWLVEYVSVKQCVFAGWGPRVPGPAGPWWAGTGRGLGDRLIFSAFSHYYVPPEQKHLLNSVVWTENNTQQSPLKVRLCIELKRRLESKRKYYSLILWVSLLPLAASLFQNVLSSIYFKMENQINHKVDHQMLSNSSVPSSKCCEGERL